MNEKLGWVREYRAELAIWNRCQDVMQASLKFTNHNGLSTDSAENLKAVLDELIVGWPQHCHLSEKMATELIEFVRQSASSLESGERAWLSTENLESSFGMFKQLEGQHSKGGFTSLIAAMPMLLVDWTPARVVECLAAVSVKQMKALVETNLGSTLASKRSTAYREFANAATG